MDDLVASNLPIGYQVGSFAYDYLTQSLFVPRSRLVELDSPEDYEKALRLGPKGGGVAAIVDELPYLELFLSKTKEFGIIGQPFTRSGWGFVSIYLSFNVHNIVFICISITPGILVFQICVYLVLKCKNN